MDSHSQQLIQTIGQPPETGQTQLIEHPILPNPLARTGDKDIGLPSGCSSQNNHSIGPQFNSSGSTQNNFTGRGNQFPEAYFYGPVQFSQSLSSHLETEEIQRDPARRKKEIEVLKCLNSSPYRDRKDQNPDRVPGTCDWFVTHKLFRSWQEEKMSAMLWVSADPGCGKSVLVKYLVDNVLRTTESRTVCYFFFKDDFEDQRSVTSALCCILYQLFQQKHILLSDTILDQIDIEADKFTHSFGQLWEALLSAADNKDSGEIVCILDAIDECKDTERPQLIKELCKLYSTKRNYSLKFLLTSRPYDEIRRGFQPLNIPELPVIHLSGDGKVEKEQISQEINIFIEYRVRDVGNRLELTDDEQELLLQELMRVHNRTYLWVYLTLDLIENDINLDKTRIANITFQLPKTVDEAYDKMLSKLSDSEKAKIILHIIVAATRPLTLGEMAFALALQDLPPKDLHSYEDLELKPENRCHKFVRDVCGLLVMIIDSKIYLLHQTVKEFLVQNDAVKSPKDTNGVFKWKHSLQPQESHRIIAEICVRYLLFAEFEANPLNQNKLIPQYVKDHVFIDYSAKYWATHLRETQIQFQHTLTQSVLRICDTNSKCCLTWLRIYWASTNTDFPEDFTTLMIGSYFGLRTVVEHLIERQDSDLNSLDTTYQRSALSWAAGSSYSVVIKLLIDATSTRINRLKSFFGQNIGVNSIDKYGRTPLSYAILSGNVAAIKLLIEAGASVDLGDDIGGTPLYYAVCNGQDEVTRLLLKGKTNIGSVYDINGKLLLSATKKGHEDIVRLLIERGANLEFKDEEGRTLLSCALERRKRAVVRLLIEHGANLDSKDKNGQTPLFYALEWENEAVIRLFIKHGANLESKDQDGQTPLFHALKWGNEAGVRLLIERGANIESQDKGGGTPLFCGLKWGNEAGVRLLIEYGASIESKEEDRTPLSWASQWGWEEVVFMLLLEHGADIESKDKDGRTPLSWASQWGQAAVVQLLLSHGANIKSKDKDGKTPLFWASEWRRGNTAVVQLLLDHGG